MEICRLAQLTFRYPGRPDDALRSIDLTVEQGEFLLLCGLSGSGKSTLLKLLKPQTAPVGERSGEVVYRGTALERLTPARQAAEIGFVGQSPEDGLATDKVWHELAFALESLGIAPAAIRLRVAEMANFFGIQNWFHQSISELSGGQKQILQLASVMTTDPAILLLDEPTAQLDPVAAAEFMDMVRKINRELGTTILLADHRLDELMPLADRALVLDRGRMIALGRPPDVAAQLAETGHPMSLAMPAAARVWALLRGEKPCPVSVREGRSWLTALPGLGRPETFAKEAFGAAEAAGKAVCSDEEAVGGVADSDDKEVGGAASLDDETVGKAVSSGDEALLSIEHIWFGYHKKQPDLLKDLSLSVRRGEILALMGGNASGKSTLLKLMAGLLQPQRGQVKIERRSLGRLSDEEKYSDLIGWLPQDPTVLFRHATVRGELAETGESATDEAAARFGLAELMEYHPYDLSGGEKQKLALAKVLARRPRLLLLDEPTKGIDRAAAEWFGRQLKEIAAAGCAIVLASHDPSFCAAFADRCALLFDGGISAENPPASFFPGNKFYTTAANRMIRPWTPEPVTVESVAAWVRRTIDGNVPPDSPAAPPQSGSSAPPDSPATPPASGSPAPERPNPRAISDFSAAPAAWRKFLSPTLWLLVPLTVAGGWFWLGDRRYFLISMLLLMEIIGLFLLRFEGRRPPARELVLIAVLCAAGVAGRLALYMLPQFKPVMAIAILAGVTLGAEAGFVVGSLSMFLSNLLMMQGPWTPWQMMAMGLVGWLGGLLFFDQKWRNVGRLPLTIFGGLAAILIYGPIMNSANVLLTQNQPRLGMFVLSEIQGLPFDFVHAVATVLFLWWLAKPVVASIDRIRTKFGFSVVASAPRAGSRQGA